MTDYRDFLPVRSTDDLAPEADAIAEAVAAVPSRARRIEVLRRHIQRGALITILRAELGWWPDTDASSADTRRWNRDLNAALVGVPRERMEAGDA